MRIDLQVSAFEAGKPGLAAEAPEQVKTHGQSGQEKKDYADGLKIGPPAEFRGLRIQRLAGQGLGLLRLNRMRGGIAAGKQSVEYGLAVHAACRAGAVRHDVLCQRVSQAALPVRWG